MSYEEDQLMTQFDKWDNRSRRERFVHRMERKLKLKQQRYQ